MSNHSVNNKKECVEYGGVKGEERLNTTTIIIQAN